MAAKDHSFGEHHVLTIGDFREANFQQQVASDAGCTVVKVAQLAALLRCKHLPAEPGYRLRQIPHAFIPAVMKPCVHRITGIRVDLAYTIGGGGRSGENGSHKLGQKFIAQGNDIIREKHDDLSLSELRPLHAGEAVAELPFRHMDHPFSFQFKPLEKVRSAVRGRIVHENVLQGMGEFLGLESVHQASDHGHGVLGQYDDGYEWFHQIFGFR